MIYSLAFKESAHKEWKKLDKHLQKMFAKKLQERLQNPRVPKDKLYGAEDYYKIKLRDVGYRLLYKVIDNEVSVEVVAIGKRDNIYKKMH